MIALPAEKIQLFGIDLFDDDSLFPAFGKNSADRAAAVSTRNQKAIDGFLQRWVNQPYTILEEGTKVGCEVNFNKFFPKASSVKSVAEVVHDIAELNKKMVALDAALLELGVQ